MSNDQCGARYELNGVLVSRCEKPAGHKSAHFSYIMDGSMSWTDPFNIEDPVE